jgi:signal peptidase I
VFSEPEEILVAAMDAQMLEQSRCSLAAEVLQSTGTLRIRAMGSSMLPTLWPGDLVTIESRKLEQVRPGEIVLYLRQGRFFLHRAVKKVAAGGEELLQTRGDSMPGSDPLVRPSEVLGAVTGIQRGASVIAPAPELSPFTLMLARALGHSNLCQRLALRFRRRSRDVQDGEFSQEQAAVV